MKKNIIPLNFLISVILLLPLWGYCKDSSRDKARINISYEVILSTKMKQALDKYNPNFKIWNAQDYIPTLIRLYNFTSFAPWRPFYSYQTPSAVMGDFNGDNMVDVVMAGHDKTSELNIAVISDESGYKAIEINNNTLKDPQERWYDSERGLYSYLTLVTPGKIEANLDFERPEIDLKTDAFKIEYFEKGSSVYIYKDGKFVSYPMSD